MSRHTRASVNTCIVLGVSSAGSNMTSISDAAARGDGVNSLTAAALRCVLAEPRAVA